MKNHCLIALFLAVTPLVSAQTFTNYTTVDGLLADNVLCVDVDASDKIWFGTQDGVSVFDGATWTSYTTADGLIDNTIQAIYVANSGQVWIGTDFGVSVYNGANWSSYTSADGLGDDQIKCITEDAAGNIWFGTSAGASKFDGVTTWTNYGTGNGLPFGGVNDIDVHTNGEVWMGTGLGGVSIFNGSTFSTINATAGLIDNRIRAMVIDDSNEKWIGTSEGITVLNGSNQASLNYTTIFALPPPDTLNPIEDIEMDAQGNMWVGVYVDYLVTEGGVCSYNGNNWNQYDVADGLIGPVVRALAIDGNDDVWVATSTGVSKISHPDVGIDDQLNSTFTIYPNPAEHQLTVRFEDGVEGSDIFVHDSKMTPVKTIEVNAAATSFSVDDLAGGIYFLRIGSELKKVLLR